MAAADLDDIASFRELLDARGESLNLMLGDRLIGSVCAIVDRNLGASPRDGGQVDFGARDLSRIKLLMQDLEEAPVTGQHFVDETGRFHRIQSTRRTTMAYLCDCKIAEADEEE